MFARQENDGARKPGNPADSTPVTEMLNLSFYDDYGELSRSLRCTRAGFPAWGPADFPSWVPP